MFVGFHNNMPCLQRTFAALNLACSRKVSDIEMKGWENEARRRNKTDTGIVEEVLERNTFTYFARHAAAYLLETLCYKSEDRGFKSR
jgi:hypothetical protein